MWTLIGVGIVVVGFLARLNPLLVVASAVIVTGLVTSLVGGPNLVEVIAAFGKAFNDNRFVSVAFLVLPVIGLLERGGLQERGRMLIGGIRAATSGRLIALYFIMRQLASALGLTSLGGQAQMVRPLVAPMAEAAAEARLGPLPDRLRFLIRAHAAGADNVAAFFGEDIFIAFGSVLLIKGVLQQNGIDVQPLQLSVWAIPTAIAALLIHGTRLLLLDRRLAWEAAKASGGTSAEAPQ